MTASEKYNLELVKYVVNKYGPEKADDFEWYVDEESETSYRVTFRDENKKKWHAVLIKATGVISMHPALDVERRG